MLVNIQLHENLSRFLDLESTSIELHIFKVWTYRKCGIAAHTTIFFFYFATSTVVLCTANVTKNLGSKQLNIFPQNAM